MVSIEYCERLPNGERFGNDVHGSGYKMCVTRYAEGNTETIVAAYFVKQLHFRGMDYYRIG